ncbi:hypothetical protein DEO23_02450 [Brachybacterium endophyticum]|uniref:Uncharacterized protein n=1 Tax=Brachybacterium endophyticum TaxID=2182385 RepID=A0A2U2RNR3_9MICO|nr:hypothetical protein [Brachybacterium endophyticum]PWH07509.1 hypothetical protein DEO23_02450 [Brachybacterium endophyticum]
MDTTTTTTGSDPVAASSPAEELELRRLVGYRVRGIAFVLSRLQIRFENPAGSAEEPLLECLAMPTVSRGSIVLTPDDERWAGALRELIAQDVTTTYEQHGVGLRLEFPYAALRVHPRPSARDGVEIASLGEFGDGARRVWTSGADCFADLHRELH